MTYAIWALIVGVLLITMALSGTLLKRLPVSTALLYLAAGYGLSPAGWGLMPPDPLDDAAILERLTEVAYRPLRNSGFITDCFCALANAVKRVAVSQRQAHFPC